MKVKPLHFLLALVSLLAIVVAACSEDEGATPVVVTSAPEIVTEEVQVTRIVEVEVPAECAEAEPLTCPEPEPAAVETVPFEMQWLGSAHADASAEAFVHWDEDDPAEVPTSCARCHSTPGYLDYIGADGSSAGAVDAAAPIGTVITCEACHNDVTVDMTSVVFPSGVEVTNLGPEARCMQCHQGRESTVSVDQKIVDAGLGEGDEDTVAEDLGFTNIHYYAAAATQFGTVTMGGYEYAGMSYDSRYEHVAGYNTCTSCHDSHTLEVKYDECVACHTDLESADDLVNVRMPGSLVDYDGDGDMTEGVYYEIEDMRAILYDVMQAYANEVSGTPIGYNVEAYPYFFIDTDGDGSLSEEEAVFPNAYNAWTPRLTRAAYNYQVSLKDPGRFAHGGKYIIQLIYDSIMDLNGALDTPMDVSGLRRIDHGHFAGSEEAFRHWDEEGAVPGSCSRCHSANGLPLYVNEGVSITQPTANGFRCDTCHVDLETFDVHAPESVAFPSGLVVSFEENDIPSNLCINCHQGRESRASVDGAVGDAADNEVVEGLNFINVHYFAAGATVFGTEAQGAYEYEGKAYLSRNDHVGEFDSCTECHDTHALEVVIEECTECHEVLEETGDLHTIRVSETDFDGDGDVTEGMAQEIATLQEALYATMVAYSTDTIGTTILYSPASYPYFFIDLNGDGVGTPDEVNFGNRYGTWTPNLLRAAYNYQYVSKDPGAFAHNGLYVLQVLYDSIEALGGDVSAYTRPVTE
ncbi:MAG: hypothetical protein KDE09_12915 [Anaerolineales bacterium]|nr:hypothetical protein [Anaerolineales bacterium]MCB8958920.1 hypothetical protein [Ardenticatenales bacterium]